ncbi:MAG: hypothetical protein KAH22_07415 [Thiotrichaceae bacterium]|nr:hypothetical protein [Thiotrichaceae bacterium]
MNIYALRGFKVIVTEESIDSGGECYAEVANIHLKVGNTYTIESTTVNNSYTSVKLQEIKTVSFSSMSFLDIDAQSEADDETHPDWVNWNTDEGYENYLKEH